MVEAAFSEPPSVSMLDRTYALSCPISLSIEIYARLLCVVRRYHLSSPHYHVASFGHCNISVGLEVLESTRFRLEAFAVDNGRTALVVLLLRDPHLLEGRK